MTTTTSELPLIIDRPDLQSPHRRFLSSVVTFLAWAIWVYLWIPLISLVAWYLGVRIFIREILLPDTTALTATLPTYLIVILLLAAALIGWSRYNLRRFRGKGRRIAGAPVADAAMAERFGIAPGSLPEIRASASQTVRFRTDGSIEFHPGEEFPPPPARPVIREPGRGFPEVGAGERSSPSLR